MSIPSVLEYSNYRKYLTDVFNCEKELGVSVNLQTVAERFGMGASLLQMVFKGKRNLTVTNIHSIARSLKLDAHEHEFFEYLVLRNQTDCPEDELMYAKRMDSLLERMRDRTRKIRVPANVLGLEWYVPAILLYLVELCDENQRFTPACYEHLSKQLNLSPASIEAVIEKLKQQNLLTYKEGEKLHIFFDKIVHSISSMRFFLNAAKEGLRRAEKDFENRKNLFLSHTITMTNAHYIQFVEDYKTLVDRYITTNDVKKSSKGVYVLNIQCFEALT